MFKEVEILRKLKGKKHAPKYLDHGSEGFYNFLVMELLGKTLSDLRKRAKKFSASTTFRVCHQCFLAIRKLHSLGKLPH